LNNSNWEKLKIKSKYHFDTTVMDPNWDCVIELGKFTGDWSKELEIVKETSKPVSWRTRGDPDKPARPEEELASEEYDLAIAGADPTLIISNFDYKLPDIFKKMCDAIGLANRMDRVHVQMPGQVFNKHLDKLEKFNPEDPSKIMRIMIQLTDWDQGHFSQYGNFTYQGWKAGDIHTFDWHNVPHSSANAGLTPRVSLLTTGTLTEKTIKFLAANNKNVIEV